MTLRCKQGDLAVIIRSDFQESIGKFVTVVAPITDGYEWYAYEGEEWECAPQSPIAGWHDDNRTLIETSLEMAAFFDCDLRPIRNQPGQDETLTWLDVPSEVTA